MVVRLAKQKDMPTVHRIAHDTWGDGMPVDEYIALCLVSPKYAKGRWFVLEEDGEIKSALICYQGAFSLPDNSLGIGSVQTNPQHRKKGFASTLINQVIHRYSEDNAIDAVFLYSDVDPTIYEKLGFVRLSPSFQKYDTSTAMIRPLQKSLHSLIGPDFNAPSYF